MPTYGLRATQFVDILGYLTISMKGTLTLERKLHIAQEAICQLKNQNRLLTEHPNAHIYAQLAGLVNFDGYYLESEPCFICTNPELPNSSLKLMGIKGEVRYSPNAMFVKLKNSYSISQFTILISDIKRSKMVSFAYLIAHSSLLSHLTLPFLTPSHPSPSPSPFLSLPGSCD